MLAVRYDEAALFFLDTFNCSADTSEKNSVVMLKYKTDGQSAYKMTSELKAAADELIGDLGADRPTSKLYCDTTVLSKLRESRFKKQSKFVSTVYGAIVEKRRMLQVIPMQ